MTVDRNEFAAWIGKQEVVDDDLSPMQAQAAAAMFDLAPDAFPTGADLPPLWHWFYFLPRAAQGELGEDGHPRRSLHSFLPPIPLPRRMFAGARLTFHQPLRIGQPARREAVIRSIETKSGRSGALAFVTVAFRYHQQTGDGDLLCIEEEQDIVYREPGVPLSAPPVGPWPELPAEAWSREIAPDSRLLFRFSALTFNAHRIHYDRPYAMSEEGYPGLVVHGPLTAMLLLQLARDNTPRPVSAFHFRGQAPLFDLAPFRLVGQRDGDCVELQAQGPDGKATMLATAQLSTSPP